jgi:hypothetical protein
MTSGPSALPKASQSPESLATPSDSSPSPAASRITAETCPNGPGSHLVANPAYRFDFRLPTAWQTLKAGDPALAKVYGTDAKGVEALVDQTTMQHFAIPLGSADARDASLAVYVRRSDAGTSTGSLAIDYWGFLTGADVGAEGPDASVRQESVILNPGSALRLTATLASPASSAGGVSPAVAALGSPVVVHILEHDSRGYFFVFRGTADALGRRAEELRCTVGSLHFKK